MYIYIYICLYIYIHTYTYIHISIYIYIHTYIDIYIYTHVDRCSNPVPLGSPQFPMSIIAIIIIDSHTYNKHKPATQALASLEIRVYICK